MEEGNETPKRRRKADPFQYERNIKKKAKVEGKSYKDYRGKTVSAKKIQEVLCR